jgi:hypothetical protein
VELPYQYSAMRFWARVGSISSDKMAPFYHEQLTCLVQGGTSKTNAQSENPQNLIGANSKKSPHDMTLELE